MRNSNILVVSDPKEATCYCCTEKGHWKRCYPKYFQDIKDDKVKRQVYTIFKSRTHILLILGSLIQDVDFTFVLIYKG